MPTFTFVVSMFWAKRVQEAIDEAYSAGILGTSVLGLFARGETKSLVVSTLGSSTDEQRMDCPYGRRDQKIHAALQLCAVLCGRSEACACFPA